MNITSLKLLFSPAYIFNPYPGYVFSFSQFFLILFGILVLLAIVTTILAAKKKKQPERPLFGYIANWAWWTSMIGLMLLFFRLQGIPYFSMRAIFVSWLVAALVWIIIGLKIALKEVKTRKKQLADEKRKSQYFKK